MPKSMSQSYAARRAAVLEAIRPGLMLVPAAPAALRNNDVDHPYRQDSDFYYLSGFDEPDSVLVLQSGNDERFSMYVRERNPEREVWDGPRSGVDGAVANFGADRARPIGQFVDDLADLFEDVENLYYALGRNREFDDEVLSGIAKARLRGRRGKRWPIRIVDPSTVLHPMRLEKEEVELLQMERAAEITCKAHSLAMNACRPGMYEYEIEALITSHFRKHGAERVAYQPIVGSGPNSTILHYIRNDRLMEEGDLLLIDAGCEFGYYAADVTRTFPVAGRFSPAQRAVYQVVLDAQTAAIEVTRPGATLSEIHDTTVRVVSEGLVALGLVPGPVQAVVEKELYKPYYMHKTSHYLGMDVHDVGPYFDDGEPRKLGEGVVITIEPGLYIAQDAEVDPKYRGIGVRIEDDVVVTAAGAKVMTEAAPKEPDEIERACQ